MSGKKSTTLGKGLGSILGDSKKPVKEAIKKGEKDESEAEIKETPASVPTIPISDAVLEKALEEGRNNPRVVVWSPKASIVLRVLRKTIPEFSMSNAASELLEEAVRRKYPEIWEKVEALLEKE